jgi:deoxyribodipyrimidine photo-lyase
VKDESPNRPIVVWFRRDLRIDDHAALRHASETGQPIVPLFIFDVDLIKSLTSDGALFDFQAEALRNLSENLESLGGRLIVRKGRVMEVHGELLAEIQPRALYFNRDYEPSALERDRKVENLYRRAGAEVKTFKDLLIQEPGEVMTGDGKPFVVFTPFANAWKKLPHASPLGKPKPFSSPDLRSGEILGARELRRKTRILRHEFTGGESEACSRWRAFPKQKLVHYAEGRDIPSVDGTSRMSPSLRFGCISIRRMLEDCLHIGRSSSPVARRSVDKFIDELIWREFYQSVLFHFPRLMDSNYRQEFDRMPWKLNEKQFEAWKYGRTGFPLVDAGMRQLNQSGWMHNRVRMVVASFLTKDLRHDWKFGQAYFEEKLMDIEAASNNGGWQWSASTGVDPKPMRIFNPRLQSERYDPEGEYIGRYVPELQNVPSKFIHAPHEMPPTLQKEIGCVIGKHYPSPIVDHAKMSAEYKRLFVAVKSR